MKILVPKSGNCCHFWPALGPVIITKNKEHRKEK